LNDKGSSITEKELKIKEKEKTSMEQSCSMIWSKTEGSTCHAVAEGHVSVTEGALD